MSSIRDGIKRLPIRLRTVGGKGFTLARVDAYPDEVKAINDGVTAASKHISCSRGSLMRGLSIALVADKTRAERVAKLAAEQVPESAFDEVVAALVDAALDAFDEVSSEAEKRPPADDEGLPARTRC